MVEKSMIQGQVHLKDKTVIVSDLHIDTWSPDAKFFGRTKLEHFLNFLDFVQPIAANFIINGDLLDAPPPNGEFILPTHEKIISRLIDLAKNSEVYYFIGNHDIGFWGLRLEDFRNLHIIYPRYPDLYIKLGDNGSRYIYLEHGHYYDPVLNLYIHNIVRSLSPKVGFSQIQETIKRLFSRLFRRTQVSGRVLKQPGIDAGSINQATSRAAQRRDPKDGAKTQPLGVFNGQEYWHRLETLLWKQLSPLVTQYYTPINWQDAAEDLFKNFCVEHPEKEVKAIIFGHTHTPDEKQLRHESRQALYLNSGDWSEPVGAKGPDNHHSSFIILDKEGEPVRDLAGNAVRDFIVENYDEGKRFEAVAKTST